MHGVSGGLVEHDLRSRPWREPVRSGRQLRTSGRTESRTCKPVWRQERVSPGSGRGRKGGAAETDGHEKACFWLTQNRPAAPKADRIIWQSYWRDRSRLPRHEEAVVEPRLSSRLLHRHRAAYTLCGNRHIREVGPVARHGRAAERAQRGASAHSPDDWSQRFHPVALRRSCRHTKPTIHAVSVSDEEQRVFDFTFRSSVVLLASFPSA